MPYILKSDRTLFDLPLKEILSKMNTMADFGDGTVKAGVLNYLTSMLCKYFIKINGTNYENLNAVCGALDCAKEEFRRRVINPYEEGKIKINGDIYNDEEEQL